MAEMTKVRARQIEFVEGGDAHDTAAAMLEQALAYCAEKAYLAGRDAATSRVVAGDAAVTGYFHYSLAKQAAAYLGDWDQDVQAAYVFDDEATPEDACFGEARRPLVHLLLRVERKTAALAALVATLDRALAAQMAAALNVQGQEYVLDVQMVDDAQVANRIGYGALLFSLQRGPMQIWGR
jgi:hypothetical protein